MFLMSASRKRLNIFNSVRSRLPQIKRDVSESGQIWTNLDKFGQIWVKFEQIWVKSKTCVPKTFDLLRLWKSDYHGISILVVPQFFIYRWHIKFG